jgi:site-specific DNA-methyltransferase (adenine-specific)
MYTLHLGDCLDVLRDMPAGSVDAVVTDPPYGIGLRYNSYDDSEANWYLLMDAVIPELRRVAKVVVLPSCAIKKLPWWYANHKPDWLIAWYKGSPGHQSMIGFNDWEPHLIYGRPTRPMHDYFQTKCGFDNNGHPCPKPVDWAKWLCSRVAPEGSTILDPFMGSGTTGVACIQTGRNFIGIEIDPGYYAIAEKRIAETQPPLEMQV